MINNEVEFVKSFFENNEYKPELLDSSGFSEAWKLNIERINILFKEKKSFFSKFDYNWIFDIKNFTNPYEQLIQIYILEIISDISSQNPCYRNLSGIIFKFLNGKTLSSECRSYDSHKYIFISKPFLYIIQKYVLLLINIYNRTLAIKGDIKDLFYQPFEILLKKDNDYLEKEVLAFVNIIFSYAQSNPNDFSINVTKEIQKISDLKVQQELLAIYSSVDMFVTCHELAHLIEDSDTLSRNLETEIITDNSAFSLFIIHFSKLKSIVPSYLYLGLNLFYEISILFLNARIISYEPSIQIEMNQNINELLIRRDVSVEIFNQNLNGMKFLHELNLDFKNKIGNQFNIIKRILNNFLNKEINQ